MIVTLFISITQSQKNSVLNDPSCIVYAAETMSASLEPPMWQGGPALQYYTGNKAVSVWVLQKLLSHSLRAQIGFDMHTQS